MAGRAKRRRQEDEREREMKVWIGIRNKREIKDERETNAREKGLSNCSSWSYCKV